MDKIMVVGLGGVGGYIGGVFADVFDNVTFIARNGRMEAIRDHGLHLISDIKGNLTVHPWRVMDKPKEAGVQDYIFICVKNYSLEQVCREIEPVVDDHTIIVPVMNGVDPGNRIRQSMKKGIVLDSLIYIVSSAEEDYSIRQMDSYATVHVGRMSPTLQEERALEQVKGLFDKADIQCIVEQDIEAAIWEKYIFNCAYNVMTARYLCNAEVIRNDEQKMNDFIILLREAYELAEMKGVHVKKSWLSSHEYRMREVVGGASTSSLKRDMEAGKESELETFSGYIVKEAAKNNMDVPMSKKYYEALLRGMFV